MTSDWAAMTTPELRWENEGGHLRVPPNSGAPSQHPDAETWQRLSGVHALLLREVAAVADAVLAGLAAHRWPQRELDGLVDYVQSEVIAETRLKERLLFNSLDTASAEAFGRLCRDHVDLRYTLEELTNAAGVCAGRDPQALAEAVRGLVAQLTEHLSREEAVLARYATSAGWQRAANARRLHPHAWYPLTREAVIDLDAVAAAQATEAVVSRVRQLRRGDHVELVSSMDPQHLCNRLLCDGDITVRYLTSGDESWRVIVSRRPPD